MRDGGKYRGGRRLRGLAEYKGPEVEMGKGGSLGKGNEVNTEDVLREGKIILRISQKSSEIMLLTISIAQNVPHFPY